MRCPEARPISSLHASISLSIKRLFVVLTSELMLISVRQKTNVLTELAFVFNLPERQVGPYGHENVFPAV